MRKKKCPLCRRAEAPARKCNDIVDMIDNAIEGDDTCLTYLMDTDAGRAAMKAVYDERRRLTLLEMG